MRRVRESKMCLNRRTSGRKSSPSNVPKLPDDTPTHELEIALAKWFGAKQVAQQLYADEVFDVNFLVAKRPLTAADAAKN
jgi:hypothetical protein